jgi:hypothetical protein
MMLMKLQNSFYSTSRRKQIFCVETLSSVFTLFGSTFAEIHESETNPRFIITKWETLRSVRAEDGKDVLVTLLVMVQENSMPTMTIHCITH